MGTANKIEGFLQRAIRVARCYTKPHDTSRGGAGQIRREITSRSGPDHGGCFCVRGPARKRSQWAFLHLQEVRGTFPRQAAGVAAAWFGATWCCADISARGRRMGRPSVAGYGMDPGRLGSVCGMGDQVLDLGSFFFFFFFTTRSLRQTPIAIGHPGQRWMRPPDSITFLSTDAWRRISAALRTRRRPLSPGQAWTPGRNCGAYDESGYTTLNQIKRPDGTETYHSGAPDISATFAAGGSDLRPLLTRAQDRACSSHFTDSGWFGVIYDPVSPPQASGGPQGPSVLWGLNSPLSSA